MAQWLSLFNTCRNYKYALSKLKLAQCSRSAVSYRPHTALIVPCKGLDNDFDQNILSLYKLDYDNYELFFVTESTQDPAYQRLQTLKRDQASQSQARNIHILTAGQSTTCSQKLHNLLHAYSHIPDQAEVLAFADSDICVRSDWLCQLVWPLRKARIGATSGYRWFVPIDRHWASLALSAVNAKVAQMLGNTRFMQAWGGSMAIRRDVFDHIGLKEIWSRALSDDYTLTYAVKKYRYKMLFVPSCLVASHLSTTWKDLFEFCRRQLIITRVSAAGTWWFGLACSLMSILGPWGALGLTLASIANHSHGYQWGVSFPWWPIWLFFTVSFFFSQTVQAWVRQAMIQKLLPENTEAMKHARLADIRFFWVWSFVLTGTILASAFGHTICWRGIRYRLLGPTEVTILTQRPK
ncbi:MAG: glycosyltransferase [Phycisphaerae bacterium]|nr:glycosyltransferase [Phycisphaerae bacterium]